MDPSRLQAERAESPSPVWVVWASRIGLVLLFAYLLIYHLHHESKDNGGHLGDFRTFYQAAQYAREHRDIYTAGPNSSQMYVYPPLIAFFYTPLTFLPVLQAAHVSLFLNAMMLLASLLLGARVMVQRLGAPRPAAVCAVAFLAALLSENEMRAVLTMLETDPLMLLMFTFGLWWLDRKPALAGMALALAFNVKYLTIVTVPYLIVRRRRGALASFVIGAVFFALLPSVLLGWHEDLRCLRVSMAGLLRWVGVAPEASGAVKVHNIADSLSVSITSALARILAPHGMGNRGALLLSGLLGLLLLWLVFVMYRRHGLPLLRWPVASDQRAQPFTALVGLEWAGLVTAALVFSPDTNTRHLVLAVLVNLLAACVLLTPVASVSRAPAAIGVILILFGFIMPFGTKGSSTHFFYFKYGIPCWCLLVGYLLILWNALNLISAWHEPQLLPTNASASRRVI